METFEAMDAINRVDVDYNGQIRIRITSDEDMPKRELQMKAVEALLTDMAMDLTEPGGDPARAVKGLLRHFHELAEPTDDGGSEEGSLIQRFKRYYNDYRKTSDVDASFSGAYEAITYSVIDSIGGYAERGNMEEIRDMIREYREIRQSVQGSNDSVKERFEQEFAGTKGPVS